MFAVFAFKIKVSIILKIIQWNYQLKNQNWAVYELGTVLLFKRFWLKHLPLDPKSYRSFRETGPWPWNSHFVFFFPFTVFVAFIPALPNAQVALNYFLLWNPLKRKMTFSARSSSLYMLYFWCKRHDLPWLTTTHLRTYKKSLYTLLFFCLAWSEKDSWRVAEIPNFTQIEDGVRNKRA